MARVSAPRADGADGSRAQAYFSMRLYKVLPKPWSHIGLGCMVLTTVRFLASVYLTVRAVRAPTFTIYLKEMGWLISLLLAAGAAVDIVIAVTMLQYLTKKREKGLQR